MAPDIYYYCCLCLLSLCQISFVERHAAKSYCRIFCFNYHRLQHQHNKPLWSVCYEVLFFKQLLHMGLHHRQIICLCVFLSISGTWMLITHEDINLEHYFNSNVWYRFFSSLWPCHTHGVVFLSAWSPLTGKGNQYIWWNEGRQSCVNAPLIVRFLWEKIPDQISLSPWINRSDFSLN